MSSATIVLGVQNYERVPDNRFASKGFNDLKQGPIQSVNCHAKPLVRQLAYDGYAQNIDVFVGATLLGKNLKCDIQGIDISEIEVDHERLFIPPPPCCISFKPNTKPATVANFIQKLEEQGRRTLKIDGIKEHKMAYIVHKITPKALLKMDKFLVPNPPRQTGCSLHKEVMEFFKLQVIVAGFLMTNSYPAFKKSDNKRTPTAGSAFVEKRTLYEVLTAGTSKKTRYESVSMTHQLIDGEGEKEKEDGKWIGKFSDNEVEFDFLVPDAVLEAKPGALSDLSTCSLEPIRVPKLPGFFFPYFDGQFAPSGGAIKDIMNRRFFRLFGEDCKEGFLEARNRVGGWAATESGKKMAHLLFVIDQSINCQGQAIIVKSDGQYLGACLLGGNIALNYRSRWLNSPSAAVLSAELKLVKTHASRLAELQVFLKQKGLDLPDGASAYEVAQLLPQLSYSTEEGVEAIERKLVESLTSKLDFGYEEVEPTRIEIEQAVKDILDKTFSGKTQYVGFPSSTDFHVFQSKAGLVLSRFGTRIPSFCLDKSSASVDLTKDANFTVDPETKNAPFELAPRVLLVQKKLTTATSDWDKFCKNPIVITASSERAGVYRNLAFGGKEGSKIIRLLRDRLPDILAMAPAATALIKKKGKAEKAKMDVDEPEEAEADEDDLDF